MDNKSVSRLDRTVSPIWIRIFGFILLLVVSAILMVNPFDQSPAILEGGEVFQFNAYSEVKSNFFTTGNLEPKIVSLPDLWYMNHPGKTEIWYQAQLNDDLIERSSEELWAVYLPRAAQRVAVYINTIKVGQSGDLDTIKSWHRDEPLLFVFSPELFLNADSNVKKNTLTIQVQSQSSDKGLLGRVYIAPASQLEKSYQWRYFFRIDFIVWTSVVIGFFSFLIAALWFLRPKDKAYAYFSIATLLSVASNLYFVGFSHSLNTVFWETFWLWSITGTQAFGMLWIFSSLNIKTQYDRKILLSFLIVPSLFIFFPSADSLYRYGYPAIIVLMVCLLVYINYRFTQSSKQGGTVEWMLFVLVSIPNMACRAYDILYINHFLPENAEHMGAYGIVLVYSLMGFFLLFRFVKSLNQAEALAGSLDKKVKQREQQLTVQYEELHILENDRTLAAERERLMRDMHDGVGGQMVGLLAGLNSTSSVDNVKQQVQDIINDFRMVVDSLDVTIKDLPTLLGTLRARIADNISRAGIVLEWRVGESLPIRNQNPTMLLNTMRIVQEAITNSVKHSGTKKIIVETGILEKSVLGADAQGPPVHEEQTLYEEHYLYVDIIDFGQGFVSGERTGRGLDSMKFRARDIGAVLEINSDQSGTKIRLILSAK